MMRRSGWSSENMKLIRLLAPLAMGIVLTLIACADTEIFSQTEAAFLLSEAEAFEKKGDLPEAYRRYKGVETFYESNDKLRDAAWAGAQRTRGGASGDVLTPHGYHGSPN